MHRIQSLLFPALGRKMVSESVNGSALSVVERKKGGEGGECRKVVLLSCGSFNPPTIAHLRMLEAARDFVHSLVAPHKVVEGIISPASSAYGKAGLLSDHHRVSMLKKAIEESDWLRVDSWEASRGEWTRTKQVLAHHLEECRVKHQSANLAVWLVGGGDLVDSFTRILPDGSHLWSLEDVRTIVLNYGLVVLQRPGSSPAKTLESLGLPPSAIHVVHDDVCPNDVSSTRLRKAIAAGRSIAYATPKGVIDYISENGLYQQ